MKLNRKQLGLAGEEKAAQYLQRASYKIVARNWRCQSGELDIIAQEADCLVFVEVRTRTVYSSAMSTSNRYGSVLEAITPRKQLQIRRLAEIYMYQHKVRERAVRFDVILIERTGDSYEINHIKHAF